MSSVPAICPQCGADISVVPSYEASICPICQTPFITQKAIGLYKSKKEVTPSTSRSGSLSVLRDYLERVRLLEKDIYTFDTTIGELKQKKQNLDRTADIDVSRAIAEPVKPAPVEKPVKQKTIWFFTMFFWFALLTAFVAAALPEYVFWGHETVIYCIFGFGILSLFLMFGDMARSSDREEKYEKEMVKYKSYIAALANYKEEDKYYHEKVRELKQKMWEASVSSKAVNALIVNLSSDRAKTERALQQLYGLDIIYRKYWGIVPITMFCEYIDSGRRTVLAGENGMYDLYETELLGKQIVGELQTVNSNLTAINATLNNISHQLVGIQRNQMLLYEAVLEGNTIAETIASEVASQRISVEEFRRSQEAAIQKIVDSSQLTAFHAEAAARRIDSLAKIEEYEFAKRNPNMLRIYSTYR